MKVLICRTSGKRVNAKGIKYIGERLGVQAGSMEINSLEELAEVLKKFDTRQLVFYRTGDTNGCSEEKLVGLPEYTVELYDDWRE